MSDREEGGIKDVSRDRGHEFSVYHRKSPPMVQSASLDVSILHLEGESEIDNTLDV